MVGEIARLVKLRPDERESRDVIMDQKHWTRNMDQKYCWQKIEKRKIRTEKNVTNENKQLNNCKQLKLQSI